MQDVTASIDDYAASMFRFERLHPRWIESCAHYLRAIFGSAIEGKIFLDYAFGRGNWSLAALQAGAKRVVAVDAAASNVRRFSDYCRQHDIHGVEIVEANILNEPIQVEADILWIYGILHHIADADAFVGRLAALRRDDAALMLLYAYDSGSLRQVVVDAARQGCRYGSERVFAQDSYLFTPRARLRARDDLTVPVIEWYQAVDLAELAGRHGLVLRRPCPGLQEWSSGTRSQEFLPHHFLCGFRGEAAQPPAEPDRPADFPVLGALADAIAYHAEPQERRKITIGLFNTHFSALPANGSIETVLVEDFLFLMHAVLRLAIPASAVGAAAPYYAAALAAASDAPRGLSAAQRASSPLARFLEANTVRL
jgi:hypothetical protein